MRERIKDALTGSSATIVDRVYGPDLQGLQRPRDEFAGSSPR
jgi:hypothetical protein